MALSSSYNITSTRDTIITRALRICNVIGEGETPSANQITYGAEALNHICKEWEADGMPVWAISQYSFTPTAGTASYVVGISSTINAVTPLKVLRAWTRVSNYDSPITVITREEYDRLGAKTTAGPPSQLMYIPPAGNVTELTGTVYLYPVPDTSFVTTNTGTVYFIGQRPFMDFDGATDNPDFPNFWHNSLVWGVADQISYEYGVGLSERGMIAKKAMMHKAEALSYGTEEGSFRFYPRTDWT